LPYLVLIGATDPIALIAARPLMFPDDFR